LNYFATSTAEAHADAE